MTTVQTAAMGQIPHSTERILVFIIIIIMNEWNDSSELSMEVTLQQMSCSLFFAEQLRQEDLESGKKSTWMTMNDQAIQLITTVTSVLTSVVAAYYATQTLLAKLVMKIMLVVVN